MGKTYQSAIEIAAAISKNFRGDVQAAATSLKRLTAATKDLKAAEKAAGAQKQLNDQVTKSKAKLDAAADALRKVEAAEKAAGGATKASTKERKAAEKATAAASKELDRATKAAEKNNEALRKMGINTANVAAEQKKLAAAGQFAAARDKLFGAKNKTPVPLMQKAGDQMRSLARDAAVLGTAAVGAGAALTGMMLKTLKTADEIGDTAPKLGISTTALQELRYGAQQSGAETEQLDKALKRLSVSIGMAKKAGKGGDAFTIPGMEMLTKEGGGGGGGKSPFAKLHLDAKKLAQLQPEDQIKQIAGGLKTLKTHAEKAAVAQAIFGKSGIDILPFLEEGADGIDALSKKAHIFGGVLSKETIEAADAADKAMKDAGMAVSGLTNTLGAAFLPVATKVFKEFATWVASNRVAIQKWAESAAFWIEKKGIPAIMKIGTELKSFGEKIFAVVNGAAKLVGGFDNLALVVGGLRLAPLAKTLGDIAIQGFKAAEALIKFAAANAGAGGGGGGVPGAGGGGLAPMLGVAGAGIAAEMAIEGAVRNTKASSWQSTLSLLDSNIGKLNFGNMSAGELADLVKDPKKLAEFAMQQAAPRPLGTPMTGGAQGQTQINIPVTIEGGTKEQVSQAMDQAKQKVLEDYDRRTSFAE